MLVGEIIESSPVATRLRSTLQSPQQYDDFATTVQRPFITELSNEIEARISVDPVTSSFR